MTTIDEKVKKRQKNLYEYLLGQKDFVSKEDIVNNVEGYQISDKGNKTHNILDDIKALNIDSSVEKIIVCKNSKFKIANEEEANKYRDYFRKCGLIQLKNCYAIDKKIKRNNQGNLLEDDNKEWESFIQKITSDSDEKIIY